jgi:hypothetical protein
MRKFVAVVGRGRVSAPASLSGLLTLKAMRGSTRKLVVQARLFIASLLGTLRCSSVIVVVGLSWSSSRCRSYRRSFGPRVPVYVDQRVGCVDAMRIATILSVVVDPRRRSCRPCRTTDIRIAHVRTAVPNVRRAARVFASRDAIHARKHLFIAGIRIDRRVPATGRGDRPLVSFAERCRRRSRGERERDLR